jgi:hypothetical protein
MKQESLAEVHYPLLLSCVFVLSYFLLFDVKQELISHCTTASPASPFLTQHIVYAWRGFQSSQAGRRLKHLRTIHRYNMLYIRLGEAVKAVA